MNWIFCITGRSGERGAGARPDQSVISQTRAWQVRISIRLRIISQPYTSIFSNLSRQVIKAHTFFSPLPSSHPFHFSKRLHQILHIRKTRSVCNILK